jgi:hypothetical protein
MTQEDKDLLFKDLCGRLPYGVKCHIGDNKPYTLSSVSDDYDGTLVRFKEQKMALIWKYIFQNVNRIYFLCQK